MGCSVPNPVSKNNNWLKDNPCILRYYLKKAAAGYDINCRKAINLRKEALNVKNNMKDFYIM